MSRGTLIFIDDGQYMVKADKILSTLMRDIGLDCEVIKTPLPKGKKYGKAEVAQLGEWTKERAKTKNPKFIAVMGSNSFQAFFGQTGIKKARGRPVEVDGRVVVPMYHPNMVLHDQGNLPTLENDFQKLKECIDFGGIPEERDLDYIIVDTHELVEEMLADLRGCVSCDLECTRLYPFTTQLDVKVAKGKATSGEVKEHKAVHNGNQPEIVSIQFGTAHHQWILPAEQPRVFSRDELEDIVERITEKLEDCYLVGHNFKFDSLWMRVRFGVVWVADFDTMIAHYLLDENDLHGLKHIAQKLLGAPDWDVGGDVKTSWSPANAKYGAHDIFYTRALRFYLGRKLFEDGEVKQVFDKIMMPCVELFTEIEFDGIYIDQSKMDDAEEFLKGEVADAERDLNEWAYPEWAVKDKKTVGRAKINWGSPQQLARLLFTDLKIPIIEYTDGGKASTSESVMLRIDHPLVGALLKWRGAQKQLSSFINGWKPYIDINGYLHPSFKLHGTVTGRLSCEHPNLQQVPRDKRIRMLITAPDGEELLEADLSQIELRIAAELADEHSMLEAFRTGVDIHWLTAVREIERGAGYKDEIIETAYRYSQKRLNYSEAVELLLEMGPDVAAELMPEFDWKEFRKKAKAINFGYLFGMWWKKFKLYARDNYGVNVTDEQAQSSRKTFFNLYGRLPKWHERQRRFARMNGYVRSLSGRKRRLPDAMSGQDTPQRREAERQAINSPVQGFANELNLMAALQIRREFGRNVVRLCGTVHDSCLMRVKRHMVEKVYRRVLEIMSSPSLLTDLDIRISVPIEAEAKIGAWGNGVKLDKWLKNQNPQNDPPLRSRAA